MRVGIVRSDIGSVYLSDVENRAQRCFSSEPAGQSRYFAKPSDAEFLAVLNEYGATALKGNNSSASVDTDPSNTLRVRTTAGAAFTVITVTALNSCPKATIVADLNTGFTNAGLNLQAVLQSNQVIIKTTGASNGPDGYIELDSVGNGSTLNSVLSNAWNSGVSVSGVTVSSLKSTVYPSSTTVNVSSGQIDNLSQFAALPTADLANLVDAVADLVAPRLVETGPVLLSFTYGILSKLTDSTFQPGGARVGLPAGVAAAVVEDDGSTPFTL